MKLPLEGIRVLDLSRYLPGPLATQIMADFGAEVIKIEDRKGELGRHITPLINGESARFFSVNRNKKSLTIDLKKDKGKEIFRRLVKDSDIVVDQFRPEVMKKMGLGYDDLKAINPGLIYCIITGYGLTGPMKDAGGHDLNYLNIAGVTEVTGIKDGMPSMCGVQIADIAGGSLYAVIGIMMAIQARNMTGEGQLCDVAMMDGALSLLSYTIGEWSGNDTLPVRGDELLTGGYATYNIYKCKDGKYAGLGAIEQKFWEDFCRKIGREDFIKLQYVIEKQPELEAEIRKIMLTRTRDEWVEFFSGSDICFTPVLTLDEVSTHPQVKARNMMLKIENVRGSGRDLMTAGVPVKLSGTPGEAVLKIPVTGEHNDEILAAAGFSGDEIKEFRKNEII